MIGSGLLLYYWPDDLMVSEKTPSRLDPHSVWQTMGDHLEATDVAEGGRFQIQLLYSLLLSFAIITPWYKLFPDYFHHRHHLYHYYVHVYAPPILCLLSSVAHLIQLGLGLALFQPQRLHYSDPVLQ